MACSRGSFKKGAFSNTSFGALRFAAVTVLMLSSFLASSACARTFGEQPLQSNQAANSNSPTPDPDAVPGVPPTQISQASSNQGLTFNWTRSFKAPFTDVNGNRLTGTEIISIVPHQGKLFAGNSYWNETRERRQGQVFVLNSASGSWQLDLQMPRRYSRVASMQPVTFRTDGNGNAINPTSILLAGATYDKGSRQAGPAGIFVRDDATGEWHLTNLGSTSHPFDYTQIRSIGFYRDKVTGVDMAFLGANPAPLGIFTGVYDSQVPGNVRWNDTPELTPQGYQRIMGFAECNGTFYAATQKQIFRRFDGPNPRWEMVKDFDTRRAIADYAGSLYEYWIGEDDIRGFRCVDNPQGDGEVLLFGIYNKMLRVDPNQGFETVVEQDLEQLVESSLGRPVHYIQTQDNVDINIPGKAPRSLIGIEVMYDPNFLEQNRSTVPHLGRYVLNGRYYAGFNKEGFYLERIVDGSNVTYLFKEIQDPSVNINEEPLARVRTFALSPFPEDQNKVIYAGGFAPWFVEVSNTAWIYRGVLN